MYFAVLVEGRRTDRVQLATRQHRLEHVRGVDRSLGRPRAPDGVELVDEEHDSTCRIRDLLEHRLQPIFEFTTILGSGDQGAHVEADDPLLLEPFGHVAAHDALGEPFDDGRFAHAGLADENRIVLGAPGQDLDHPADLVIAADDRGPARRRRRGAGAPDPAPRPP